MEVNGVKSGRVTIWKSPDLSVYTSTDKSDGNHGIIISLDKNINKQVMFSEQILYGHMVFNGRTVMSVAHLSAEIWQLLRRIPPSDRLSSREMLELVCLFPLQQLGRFALWLLTFLCLPPPLGLLYPEEDDRDHAFAYGSASASIATYQNHFHLHFEWSNSTSILSSSL